MDAMSYPSEITGHIYRRDRDPSNWGGAGGKNMKAYLLFVVPTCLLAHAAAALAQDAPVTTPAPASQPAPPLEPSAPPASPPQINLTKPPPANAGPSINVRTAPVSAPIQRKYHFHEGFYLRASVGFSDYRASYSDGNRNDRDFDEHASGMALDLLIGGSPSPGISIGGGILLNPLFGHHYERGGVELGSHGGYATLIGPFVDGFPDPTRGWHVGGMIGIAGQSFQNVNATGNDSHTAAGIGGAAWFGYDFWVADEWGIGPQLRLMGMRTSDTKSGEDVAAFARSFTLGMSVVFN